MKQVIATTVRIGQADKCHAFVNNWVLYATILKGPVRCSPSKSRPLRTHSTNASGTCVGSGVHGCGWVRAAVRTLQLVGVLADSRLQTTRSYKISAGVVCLLHGHGVRGVDSRRWDGLLRPGRTAAGKLRGCPLHSKQNTFRV